jgi:hypothetical protein
MFHHYAVPSIAVADEADIGCHIIAHVNEAGPFGTFKDFQRFLFRHFLGAHWNIDGAKGPASFFITPSMSL